MRRKGTRCVIEIFGRTGREVSEIGFGAWAIGASWGHVDENDALDALRHALDSGVTFIDTADVYGDGRSEKLIARVLKERGADRPFVATKAGRRLPSQTVAGYTQKNLTEWIERSLRNLEVDTLDLVQLHCPPTDLYYHPEVFGFLDTLKQQGKIRDYGVSVERIEEAIKAIEYPGVVSIQIIYNIFRQRPEELLFDLALQNQVAIIARVPLASGLLSGKFRADSKFEETDHRQFNRNGEAFDVGETFSGVPYDVGLAAVERVRPLVADSHHYGALRAAVDPDVRGCHGRNSWRAQCRAGSVECRSGRAASARAGGDGEAQSDLRRGYPAACPPALVVSRQTTERPTAQTMDPT